MVSYLVIDVDGYAIRGNAEKIAKERNQGKTGFRARELAWIVFNENSSKTRNLYFVDSKEMVFLWEDVPSIKYCHEKLHGLPINPERTSYPSDSIIKFSSHLKFVIADVLDQAKEWAKARSSEKLIVLHKGGPEGKWIHEIDINQAVIDIGTLGCPKVESLSEEFKDRKYNSCECHPENLSNHCPLKEVSLFAAWYQSYLKNKDTQNKDCGCDQCEFNYKEMHREAGEKREKREKREKGNRKDKLTERDRSPGRRNTNKDEK